MVLTEYVNFTSYDGINAAPGAGSVTLTNVDNTISGSGSIGEYNNGASRNINLINQSGGVILADGYSLTQELTIGDLIRNESPVETTVKNDGLDGRILAAI